MTNYYFLASALPPVHIGEPIEMNFEEFRFFLKVNLRDRDYAEPTVVRRYYDLQNLRLLWQHRKLDEKLGSELNVYGNYDENGLDEALLTRDGFPDYVYEFVDEHDRNRDRVANFPALVGAYFSHEIAAATGFLREYLLFDRDWRLVFTGFRAKQLGRNLASELQHEDPHDSVVHQLLAQKDADHYEPPGRYKDLKELFANHGDVPIDLHKKMCEYRFAKVESLLGTDMFSSQRILGYTVQLIIAEKWAELDQKQGLEVIDSIVKEGS